MKKIVYLLMILTIISCSTESADIPNSNELSIEDIFKDVQQNTGIDYNYINISASNIHGKTAQVNVHRNMKLLLKKGSENTLSINQSKINFGESNMAVYTESKKNLSSITPSFGKKITISLKSRGLVKGTETLNQEVEVYNPAMIKATNKEELYNIDITNDVTINWNADPLNDLPISIVLISRQLDSKKNIKLKKVVNDVGTFTINSSELSIFTKGSKIDVILSRGNSETFGDTVVNLYNVDLISSEVKK